MTMKRWKVAVAALLAAAAVYGTTINGIQNQIIALGTNHGVLLSQGSTADIISTAAGTTDLALVGNGSSSDPTFRTLPNAGLTNSSVTVNTTTPLGGGGAVSLGASLTLTCTTCDKLAGVTNASAGATPTWTVANGDIAWTLNTNATATVTVAAGDQWRHVVAQICQDATGGRTFAWPSNVKGGMTIGATASKCSMQAFESFDGTNLYAVNTGVINQ